MDFKHVYLLTDSAFQSKHVCLNIWTSILFLFFSLSLLVRVNILYSYFNHDSYPLKLLLGQTDHKLEKVVGFSALYYDTYCISIPY